MTKRTLDRNDDLSHRAWPVSPAKYPLSGPSRGPVYAPKPPTRNPVAFVVNLLLLSVICFAFGFAAYLLVMSTFK